MSILVLMLTLAQGNWQIMQKLIVPKIMKPMVSKIFILIPEGTGDIIGALIHLKPPKPVFL